jgi:hypothetical protein
MMVQVEETPLLPLYTNQTGILRQLDSLQLDAMGTQCGSIVHLERDAGGMVELLNHV